MFAPRAARQPPSAIDRERHSRIGARRRPGADRPFHVVGDAVRATRRRHDVVTTVADGCPSPRNALQCRVARFEEAFEVAAPAERMRTMRDRRRAQGLRELRLVLPDARSPSVRRRVAIQAAGLRPGNEDNGLSWIEGVSEFDEPDRSGQS